MKDDRNLFIKVRDLSKTFVLHHQGGARIEAFNGLSLDVWSGECLALHGPSGAGKSTLLRSLYANYRPSSGRIFIRHGAGLVEMVGAAPRTVLEVRKSIIGYVSQFLRVIPRVSALDIVAEGLTAQGTPKAEARRKAGELLERLRIPGRLWNLAPATFSGGEQQRVNIARGFIRHYPVLLLDEPTASLDAANRATVVELIREAKARGAAVVGIFHNDEVRGAVSERVFSLKGSTVHV
ncbi:MAG: phosphonate C-P lyase system protein PhnL [Deltaproteobacteria bacterium]|jgi:alpha-D-ribose 1-methylphosphonate 5-triphosphate synthase subunit PhnL|nr:phosphonate C-P lyase system protein PhnL [Deltaproteobacteria bacterium]